MYVLGFVFLLLLITAWIFGAVVSSRIVKPRIDIHEDFTGFWLLVFGWPIILVLDKAEHYFKKEENCE